MSADEEGVEASSAKFDEIVVGTQPGFADGEAIVRDTINQFERSFDASRESFESRLFSQ